MQHHPSPSSLTRSGPVSLTDHVGHASLVADEGSQVARLALVVLGEGLDAAAVAAGTLLGVEPHRAMAGCLEFTVRLRTKGSDEAFI